MSERVLVVASQALVNNHPKPSTSSNGLPNTSSPLNLTTSSGTASSSSDIRTDHPAPRLVLNPIPAPPSASAPFPITVMGQSLGTGRNREVPSTPTSPTLSSPLSATRGLTAVMANSTKIRRAFGGRRKKSEDAASMMDRSSSHDESSQQEHQNGHLGHRKEATPSSASPPAQVTNSYAQMPGHSLGAKYLSQFASQVFNVGGRKASKSLLQQELPPTLPPKPDVAAKAQLRPQNLPKGDADHRSSIIPISPGISSAVSFMRMTEEQKDKELKDKELKYGKQERQAVLVKTGLESLAKAREEKRERAKDYGEKMEGVHKTEMRDSWRMSDSTIGHHTIRPGASNGRPSRPVSMADSLQSTNTIMPVNKRLSALITDAEFGMPEEDDLDRSLQDDDFVPPVPDKDSNIKAISLPTEQKQYESPTSSMKGRNRRSMSLSITTHAILSKSKLLRSPSGTSASRTRLPEITHLPTSSLSREASVCSQASSNTSGLTTPSLTRTLSTGNNAWGRLTLLTNVPTPSPSSAQHRSISNTSNKKTHTVSSSHLPSTIISPLDRNLPALPKPSNTARSSHAGPSLRQTAVSITSGLAPAAGLAKRAVEKMGRAWGGISSGSSASHTSGYSSSSSSRTTNTTAPSSYSGSRASHGGGHSSCHRQRKPNDEDNRNELAWTASSQSTASAPPDQHATKKGRMRRRTPNAPSGVSVVSVSTSSASVSDSEIFGMSTGPTLGKQVRGPLRTRNGDTLSGGVVFGRDLRTVVRETGVGVGKPKAWSGWWRNWPGEEENQIRGGVNEVGGFVGEEAVRVKRTSVRRGQLKALEERKLPALVVRCAQHLLIWGIQEEGLFRVNGRPSHVSKLRAEFDSGADFDMSECGPGDLDPHAVSSIFKAFLRELPEPVLTYTLLPYFDAAMTQESTTNAMAGSSSVSGHKSRGGALSGPRGGSNSSLPIMRKPPSLSTLSMPSLTSMRPPSKSLLKVLQSLLSQLPEENRDLIRTVAELIKATARESKQTKMPLSNLLLVFCPSLNMNPPLLKVLCEGEGIWDDIVVDIGGGGGVLDIRAPSPPELEPEEMFEDARDGTEDDVEEVSVRRRSEDVPDSVEYHGSSEDAGERSTDDSSSLLLLAGAPIIASHLRDDGSSYVSISEDQDNPRINSPPLLTSSAESLDTPESTSGYLPYPYLPIKDETNTKDLPYSPQHFALRPTITDPSRMGLTPNTARRPTISQPIPIIEPVKFPSSSSDASHPTATRITKRRSIPVLSLPSFSPPSQRLNDKVNAQDTSSKAKEVKKKTSLQLLFSKSNSPLFSQRVASHPNLSRLVISGPYLQTTHASSDSSVSTPISAVTAPQSSTFTLPPKIETPIYHSPLKFGVGLGIDDPLAPPETQSNGESASDASHSPSVVTLSASALEPVTPPSSSHTPIADWFQLSPSPASSLKSSLPVLHDSASPTSPTIRHLRPSIMRSRTSSSSSSSNHLHMLDDQEFEGDWTRTVLLAADVDGDGGWALKTTGGRR